MDTKKHNTPITHTAQAKQQYQKPDIQVIELTHQPALLAGSGVNGKRDGYPNGGNKNW